MPLGGAMKPELLILLIALIVLGALAFWSNKR